MAITSRDLPARVVALEAQVCSLRQAISELKAERKELHDRNMSLDHQVTQLHGELRKAWNEVATLNGEVDGDGLEALL